jgi:hypothetical protein
LQILEAFHHPYFNIGNSQIQQEMFEEMERWIGSFGPEESGRIINALTKVSALQIRTAAVLELTFTM